MISVGAGLSTAAILALSAVAFTLQYAVSKIANFAHGELLTIGAYAAYSSQHVVHGNLLAASLVAIVAGALAGLVLDLTIIERFQGRYAITVFIATLGASLIAQNLLVIIYGAANVSYSFTSGGLHHIGPFLWTTLDLEVIGSALAIAIVLYGLLQHTRFGKAIRAIAQNRSLAQVSGIPARRVIMQTWALAGAIAGFAGFMLAASVGTFGPGTGFGFLLLTLTAAVAGGLGRPYGTLGGALLVGLVVQVAGAYTSSAYQLVYAFGLLVVLLLARPQGIFVRHAAVRA